MQVANVPRLPNRPQVRRMSRSELQETRISNDFDSTSISVDRWRNRRQSQVVPQNNNAWRPNEVPPRNLHDDEGNKCVVRRSWFWLFGGVFCLILIIAVVAVVLGIVLPMTTTAAPDSNATPKMAFLNSETSTSIICSNIDRGSIALLNESIPSGWISYSYNYTATQTAPILLFGFETDGTHTYYLDAVSVVDNSAPSIELLMDPSFENSTINATDWIKSCETTCASYIVSGSQCFGSSGNCFMTSCPIDNSSISFLSQSFTGTIGNTYTISFMLNRAGNSSTGIMSFYLDVI